MTSSDMTTTIEHTLKQLIGLQLFKAWNVYGTRMFYFAAPGAENQKGDGEYRLTLECPWRIERDDHILVGSEDYELRAEGNSDPAWNPTEMQWGHRQDQKLEEILGESKNGAIFNTKSALTVEFVTADVFGGFKLGLSGGYALATFPASEATMEWLLSRSAGGNLALTDGVLSGSPPPHNGNAGGQLDRRRIHASTAREIGQIRKSAGETWGRAGAGGRAYTITVNVLSVRSTGWYRV